MPRIREEEEVFEVPLTPLIDVVFLLLIFFLVATTFTRSEIDHEITLPSAQAGARKPRERKNLVLNIRKQGAIVVDGRVIEFKDLSGIIDDWHVKNPGKRLAIRGDGGVSYQNVMRVMGVCRSVGVTNIDLPVVASEDK